MAFQMYKPHQTYGNEVVQNHYSKKGHYSHYITHLGTNKGQIYSTYQTI